MNTASIGSISHGTLRTEDLLDSFSSELEDCVQRNAEVWCSDAGRAERDRLMALIGKAREIDFDNEDLDPEKASNIISELETALEIFAPENCYFGSHEGDGSDFGFWPLED